MIYTAMLFQYLKYFVEYEKFALSGAVGSKEGEKDNALPGLQKVLKVSSSKNLWKVPLRLNNSTKHHL